MPVHRDIAALRGNPALQHVAQARIEAALAEWREGCGFDGLERELECYAAGEALDALTGLAGLFDAEAALASRLVGELVRTLAAALRDAPLAQLSLRHALDDCAATLVLARSGAAALSLQVLDGATLATRPQATTAVFQPSQAVARVLRGSGAGRLVRIGTRELPTLTVTPLELQTGQTIHTDGQLETLLIDRIEQQLVLLKVQRRCVAAGPAREYDLASGALLRQAAGSPRDSRLELATALLARMGRPEAAPLLAKLAQEPGSAALRWHALRECLALDSGAGFAVLQTIAKAADDPLASPAAALRSQLIATHPQLQEAIPCPA